MNYHHTTESETDFCPTCKRPRLWYWNDKNEKSGHSESYHGFVGENGECADCYKKRHGKRPKTLHELNEERKNQL